jgi:hypothetical protein
MHERSDTRTAISIIKPKAVRRIRGANNMARQMFGYDTSVTGTNPTVHSKADRSKGRGISAPFLQHPLDTAEGGTGNVERHRPPAPSEAAHSNTDRLPAAGIVKTVGHLPDGSGRIAKPNYAKTTRKHGSDRHEPADIANTNHASGQMNSAEPSHGKPSLRPAPLRNAGTSTADAGALAGDPHSRASYHGGKGLVR